MTPQHRSLLVVEDDDGMRRLLTQLLSDQGYEVQAVADPHAALFAVAHREPALVLLDLLLEAEDGRNLLHELRRISDAPVIFLTGQGAEIDRIADLRMGPDDYILKPFSYRELSARVQSVLSRNGRGSGPGTPDLEFGSLVIDVGTRQVSLDGRVIELAAKEFKLLAFLATFPRQAFTRGQLLDRVWSSSSSWQTEATVTEHVRRLRRKLNDDSDEARWIKTVRGIGYLFEPDEDSGRPTAGHQSLTGSV